MIVQGRGFAFLLPVFWIFVIQRCGAVYTFVSKKYDAEYCKDNDFIKADTSVDADLQWYIEIAVNFN